MFPVDNVPRESQLTTNSKINNNWNNPFDISKELTILVPIEVGIGFTYVVSVMLSGVQMHQVDTPTRERYTPMN
jgi:hypothetical protein